MIKMRKEIEVLGHRFTLRSWTYGMKQRALKAATSWTKEAGELQPDVDPFKLNDMMLVECIEEWSLELPITIESLHGIEPPELVEQLITECQSINGMSPGERKKS